MAPRTAPKPRQTPDVLPNSLPPKIEPDVMPDDLRRRDPPETPDSLPRVDNDVTIAGSPSEDGGVAQHPIHDEDQEDMEPQDYEAEIDRAERETLAEHPEGSAPPLDRLTRERMPETEDR